MAAIPRVVDVARDDDQATRRGSRSRRRSARPRGRSASTRTTSSRSPASPRARASSASGPRRSSTALKEHLAFLEGRGPAAVDRDLADRPGEVRPEARAGARRRALGRRGARARPRPRRPRRARDGRDRPAALGRRRSPASRSRPTTPRAAATMIRRVLADARPRTTARPRRSSPTPGRPSPRSRPSSPQNDILRLPEPDQCRIDRDARVHARQLGGLPEPGPAARPARRRASTPISPPPADWDAERVDELPPGIQPVDAQDPDDPRGLSRPLRPARVQQPAPVADPQASSRRAPSPRAGPSTPSR